MATAFEQLDRNRALRDRRRAAGWTQDALSERSGVSRGTIIRLERGADPLLTTARRLARVLDASLDDLFPASREERYAEGVARGEARLAREGQKRQDRERLEAARAWSPRPYLR